MRPTPGVATRDRPPFPQNEQKAVCILLTLLHLGIKNIKLGATPPAFASPNVLAALVENYGIAPTTTVEADMAELLGR